METKMVSNEIGQLESIFQYICNLYNMLDYLNSYLKSGDDYVAFAIRNAIIDSMLIKLRAFIDNKIDRQNINFSLDSVLSDGDLSSVKELKKELEQIINVNKTIAHLDENVIKGVESNSFDIEKIKNFILKIDLLLMSKSNRKYSFISNENLKLKIINDMRKHFKSNNK